MLQQAKLQQGLAKFSWQLESPDRSCEALSSYLVREKDIAIVDYVLEPLTGTTIPDVDVVDEKQVHAIIHAVTDLTNLMFTPSLDRIPAVLDWEMATLGDTLADVGIMLSFWDVPGATPNPITRGLATGAWKTSSN